MDSLLCSSLWATSSRTHTTLPAVACAQRDGAIAVYLGDARHKMSLDEAIGLRNQLNAAIDARLNQSGASKS